MHAYALEHLGDVDRGGDFGTMRTVYIGGGGPLYVGAVAKWFSFETAFHGLVLCLLGSAVIVFWRENMG